VKTILKPHVLGGLVSLLLLCACATVDPARPRLPADVAFNKNAGRGTWLFVTLRLESGEQLPFLLDTGAPWTFFDKSQEPKLGKRLDTGTAWNFGTKQESGVYAAPRLYLGGTLLMMTGTNVGTIDCKKIKRLNGGTGQRENQPTSSCIACRKRANSPAGRKRINSPPEPRPCSCLIPIRQPSITC